MLIPDHPKLSSCPSPHWGMWADLDGDTSRCKPATPTMELRMRWWQQPSGAGFRGGCGTPMRRRWAHGSNLNLAPKLTQLPHGKPGQQRGRGSHDGSTSLPLTWWTTGQQDQPNAYVANPTTTWPAQRLCGETTTAGVMHTWQPPWWQDHCHLISRVSLLFSVCLCVSILVGPKTLCY